HRRILDAIRHVLGINRACGVVISANAADAAGNKVRVARIFSDHEDAVTAEQGRSRMTFLHTTIAKIYLGEDTQVSDDPRDRIPRHFNKLLLCHVYSRFSLSSGFLVSTGLFVSCG